MYFTIEPDRKDAIRRFIPAIIRQRRQDLHTVTFVPLSAINDDDANQLFVEDVINEQSKYLNVKFNANHYVSVNDPQYQVINAIW